MNNKVRNKILKSINSCYRAPFPVHKHPIMIPVMFHIAKNVSASAFPVLYGQHSLVFRALFSRQEKWDHVGLGPLYIPRSGTNCFLNYKPLHRQKDKTEMGLTLVAL